MILALALCLQQDWSGANSRILDTRTLLIDNAADWERVWRQHEGPRAKPPAVDFTKLWAVAHFEGAWPGADRPMGRMVLKGIEDGVVKYEFEKAPGGAKTTYPWWIATFAKPANGRVWFKAKGGGGGELAARPLAHPDVIESWSGLRDGAEDYQRITDAAAWEKAWKRAHPDVAAPEIDFEKTMVIAAFLPPTSGAPGVSVEKDVITFSVFSGPAVEAPRARYVLAVLPGRNAKLTLKLSVSSFAHEMKPPPPVVKELKTLDAVKKYKD